MAAPSLYPFEAPTAFFADFGTPAMTATQSATVILSEPGQDLMGGQIQSTQREIEFLTSELTLSHGAPITVRGMNFRVLEVMRIDDGTFSRARLET
jgi:hypothetical protein